MTSSLRARATAATTPTVASEAGWPNAAQPGAASTPPAEPAAEQPIAPVEAPEGLDDDPPSVPIAVALARVMRDIGKIGKADRFEGGNAGRYNYRGVDRVVNAAGPVLRKHGVIVLPEVVTAEYRDIARANNGRSHECVVTVRWHWVGPAGDELTCTTQGEALDTSDKATAKAQSVAWRVALIQTLAIVTGDPDPDSVRIERGDQPMPRATDYRDEIADPRTSLGRLRQIRGELRQHQMANVVVTNDVGDDEPLLVMCERIGRQRAEAGER